MFSDWGRMTIDPEVNAMNDYSAVSRPFRRVHATLSGSESLGVLSSPTRTDGSPFGG